RDRQMGWTLRPHGCRWFDRRYIAIRRFIGSCACADVQDGSRIAQSAIYLSGYCGIGFAKGPVGRTDLAIIYISGAAVCAS
ncbi:MAG: hypothetical protein MK010_11345, partial [Erythrobacter sp.]|nr:hypothetical protein [Erythrobacter sp.]